jgi:hypothetical protein
MAALMLPNKSVPTEVYRLYDDRGDLVYVGLSLRMAERMSQHRMQSDWWESVTRIEIERFPDRCGAEKRERELIAMERPKHNRSAGTGAGLSESFAFRVPVQHRHEIRAIAQHQQRPESEVLREAARFYLREQADLLRVIRSSNGQADAAD